MKKEMLSPSTVEDYRGKFRYLSDVPMPTTPEQAKRAKSADSIAYLRKTTERDIAELDTDFLAVDAHAPACQCS